MATGLPVSRLINVSVNLEPAGAQLANFDSLLIMGSSDVINVHDRIRSYSSLQEVAADFGTTAPEYLAADLYYSQLPQPTDLYIGRWAETASKGLLVCGALTASEQAISNWTSISAGSFDVTVDGGAAQTITGLDFSAVSNMNGVAAIINGALSGCGCTWNGSQFVFESASTGTSSSVSYLTSEGTGTDISTQLKGTSATASEKVDGIAAETPVAAVTLLDSISTDWYGLMFASTTITDDQQIAVADYIEGDGRPHLYGMTETSANAYDPASTTDLGYRVQQGKYNRSLVQYSENAYAIASLFGRAFTVNFQQANSTITLMYKQEPSVVPEYLTATQADALDAKFYTYYAWFQNNTAIIVNGQMGSGIYFDEIHGADWFANQIQTDVYNLLYTSPTKIPQTDAGNQQIGTVIEGSCDLAVNNGYVAPGTWDSQGVGQVAQGDYLDKGYYVYVPPISSQSSESRLARESVPIVVLAKLAGAVQSVNVQLNINR